jgi:hypothetical protein
MIRLATKNDAKAFHDLHTKSVRGLCSKDYPPEVIDGWLAGRSPDGYKKVYPKKKCMFLKRTMEYQGGFMFALIT